VYDGPLLLREAKLSAPRVACWFAFSSSVAVCALSSPAGAQIPETPVTTPLLGAYGTPSEREPAIAGNGNGYLVAWHDNRAGVDRILCGRLSATNAPLDGSGFWLSRTSTAQQNPAIVYAGGNYFVAWQDQRNGATTGTDIYAARVAPNGTVLDPGGFVVSNALGNQTRPRLAYNGQHVLAVWEDTRAQGPADVYATRLNPATREVLEPQGILVTNRPNAQTEPNAAALGTDFYVTWDDADPASLYQFLVARVSGEGEVTPVGGQAITGHNALNSNPEHQRIATGNGQLFVAAAASYDVVVFAVNPSTLQTTTTTSLVYTVASFLRPDMGLVYGGNLLFPAWQTGTYSDYLSLAFTPTAAVLGQPAENIGSNNTYQNPGFDIAFDGTTVSAAFIAGNRVRARTRVPGSSWQTGSSLVSARALPQESPSIAYGSQQHLVAFAETAAAGDTRDVLATRVSPSGVVLDDPPLYLTNTVVAGGVSGTSAGYTDGVYLVAWDDLRAGASDRNVYAARVGEDASVLDTTPISVSSAAAEQSAPRVAGGDGQYLVVWRDLRGTSAQRGVYAARVGIDGVVPAADIAGIPVSVGTTSRSAPNVTFDGSSYVIAWSLSGQIHVRRMAPNGTLGTDTTVSNTDSGAGEVAIAQQGDYTALSWEGTQSGYRLGYAVIDRNNQVVEKKYFTTTNQYSWGTPRMATNGRYAVVAYGPGSTGSGTTTAITLGVDQSYSGPLQSFFSTRGDSRDAWLSANPTNGRVLATYSHVSSENTWGSELAYFREVPVVPSSGGTGGMGGMGGAGMGGAGMGGSTGGAGAGGRGGMGAAGSGGATGGGAGGTGTAGTTGVGGVTSAGAGGMTSAGAGGATNAGASGMNGAGTSGTPSAGTGGAPTNGGATNGGATSSGAGGASGSGGLDEGGAGGEGNAGGEETGGTSGAAGISGGGGVGAGGSSGASSNAGSSGALGGAGASGKQPKAVADEDAGCGCRVPARRSGDAWASLLGLALLAGFGARRRREPR
jgi:hypothetical protein